MTSLILFLAGLLGILTHNLMKIDKLNRANPDKFTLKSFINVEWPSICLSLTVVAGCLIGRTYVESLESVGKWLGLGFYCIGLSSQSIAYFLKNRTESEIKKQTPPDAQ